MCASLIDRVKGVFYPLLEIVVSTSCPCLRLYSAKKAYSLFSERDVTGLADSLVGAHQPKTGATDGIRSLSIEMRPLTLHGA